MNLRPVHTIGLTAILLLVAGTAAVISQPETLTGVSVAFIQKQEQENAVLTPCSRFTEGYMQLPFATGNFAQWPTLYHEKAGAVVEEHLQSFLKPAKCDATTGAEALPAGPKLQELARMLPSWKNATVSQTEVGAVLLEYLRAYECALQERLYFLHPDALEELKGRLQNAGAESEVIDISDLIAEVSEEDKTITREYATARPTLHRALTIVGGLGRLLPLHGELQCIERASLDIRNALALGAEASACLPRIWNAKDPLRDLQP
ncbi:MAG TPA: hypothetical protein DEB30_00485 [Candidatus Peribacter riflensis]|uniref:Uncharacterized protein n=1 Tax=Candidatus Peribacter riflensis TaxID=1735162 RepID=A0A0S1SGD7_9BACT|nr:MAG: hypothetical protein PeribacterA2_1004 [Candidatus Peribacter riflensis]OGJ82108.1 MAG: hypothetical protein A2412_00050 [Candidatus Peribacteria bacterium RIFOXYC1_FULL_58_8]ALM11466.1 MAG: hypothetical protein PeribacterB2_1006 [Candidatus Peribacter riflensis]ALM12568.1 MAG: hypothetical protein PeribacterC2_1005 [Candidatus Peribacter riflensis]ALM13669.1 MAG: hypothetical protein PeribacterD1_1004 [Candidatus Peribacter riflensis]